MNINCDKPPHSFFNKKINSTILNNTWQVTSDKELSWYFPTPTWLITLREEERTMIKGHLNLLNLSVSWNLEANTHKYNYSFVGMLSDFEYAFCVKKLKSFNNNYDFEELHQCFNLLEMYEDCMVWVENASRINMIFLQNNAIPLK